MKVLNENFVNLYNRWKTGDSRIEDKIIGEFINSRGNKESYYIDENGLVSCYSIVSISNKDLVDGKLPVKFGKVEGHFDLSSCSRLTSLEGCPYYVGKDFDLSCCCDLTSLKYFPKEVGGDIILYGCSGLKSLVGLPNVCNSNITITGCNALESFKGLPEKIVGNLSFNFYKGIDSLDGFPKEIMGDVHKIDSQFGIDDIKSVCKVGGRISKYG